MELEKGSVGAVLCWNKKVNNPFFCPPDHLALNANNYVEILEREIQRQREGGIFGEGGISKEDASVELILFYGLVRTFPCSEDK
tara:strand:- start:115 stop:366 length:252 start_codon:yes stop_codon:yes gene_type:complete